MKLKHLILFFFVFLNGNECFSKTIKLMVYGDSLVAGFGLMSKDSFPSQLQYKLNQNNFEVDVINAGVSGETTAGGLNRLEWTISEKPDAIILVLGGNDMLRGLPTSYIKENLSQILKILKREQIEVLLAGMLSTENFGKEYKNKFDAIYPNLSSDFNVVFFPFFLENVALIPWFNQNDGLHPNKDGVKVITSQIFPFVEKLLQKVKHNSN